MASASVRWRGLAGDVAVQVADMALQFRYAILERRSSDSSSLRAMGQPLQGCGGGSLLLAQRGKRVGGDGLAGGGPGLLLGASATAFRSSATCALCGRRPALAPPRS